MVINFLVTTILLGYSVGSTQANPSNIAALSEVASSLVVDLGYAAYQGEPQGQLNAWLGIRYAAPPLGDKRWRAPKAPAPSTKNSNPIHATQYGPQCPQCPQSPLTPGFSYQGNEDCLFLNVWAPEGAKNLPVMFYIHGGGYGLGNGNFNVSEAPLAQAANYSFVSVVIQYRLGAFGFLASPDIKAQGSLNAGILDQYFALEWTHKHIHKFGGDPSRVTLVGQSAGAGSIMLQAMAKGGEDGDRLFQQGIASSPYAPAQYVYSDSVPVDRYHRFSKQSGCTGTGKKALECLRQSDTDVLQKANAVIGAGVNYGSWAFVPVTDGVFIRDSPSQQLPTGKLNGKRILTSNNANEGAQFVDPNITTNAKFDHWLKTEYPSISRKDLINIDTTYYPPRDVGSTPYASCGDCGAATAVNVGSFAVGPQQRAINLYSETTFDCPSYWLAEGMSKKVGEGFKYEFSVVPSFHGFDLGADGLGSCPNFFTPEIGPDMCVALTQIWANFIVTGNPSISNSVANGNSSEKYSDNPASRWPIFKSTGANAWQMLNLNQSGGVIYTTAQPLITGLSNVTVYGEPGLKNNITEVNGRTWEGGRVERCNFWRTVQF